VPRRRRHYRYGIPLRAEGYNFLVLAEWTDSAITNRCIEWRSRPTVRWSVFLARDDMLNYLNEDETGEPVAAAYGPNYSRLREIKRNTSRQRMTSAPKQTSATSASQHSRSIKRQETEDVLVHSVKVVGSYFALISRRRE